MFVLPCLHDQFIIIGWMLGSGMTLRAGEAAAAFSTIAV
jgi:hypothetical protein